MLDDGSHSGDGQGVVPNEAGGDVVLEGHAELGLARGHQHFRAVLGGLHHLHLQADILKITVGHGHIDAGVVGVGGPVQHEGDLLQVLLSVLGVVLGLLPAGSERRRQAQGQRPGQQAIRPFLHHLFLLFSSSTER